MEGQGDDERDYMESGKLLPIHIAYGVSRASRPSTPTYAVFISPFIVLTQTALTVVVLPGIPEYYFSKGAAPEALAVR